LKSFLQAQSSPWKVFKEAEIDTAYLGFPSKNTVSYRNKFDGNAHAKIVTALATEILLPLLITNQNLLTVV